MTKKRKKKFNKTLVIIVILSLLCLEGYFLLKKINLKSNNNVESIASYGYVLYDNDTKITKAYFNELKSVLSSETIDYFEYAKCLSKLFITDLYTLNNKHNKYEVRSSQYIYPEYQDNFKLKVSDTIYNYIGSVDKTKLPEVSNAEVVNITENSYLINDKELKSYEVELSWEYKTELDYLKSSKVISVLDNNKLYIVEVGDKK